VGVISHLENYLLYSCFKGVSLLVRQIVEMQKYGFSKANMNEQWKQVHILFERQRRFRRDKEDT
jgi:hypothetical protein